MQHNAVMAAATQAAVENVPLNIKRQAIADKAQKNFLKTDDEIAVEEAEEAEFKANAARSKVSRTRAASKSQAPPAGVGTTPRRSGIPPPPASARKPAAPLPRSTRFPRGTR